MEKNNDIEEFDEEDREYWEKPDEHALVKRNADGKDYYVMLRVKHPAMMKLCDDFDYALKLSTKMMEHGVKVFDDFNSFNEWYKKNNTNE